MFSWQLQEALGREPSAARVLVGVYTRDEHWFPTAYRINTARGQAAGEHWVGVFLEHSQHAECFDSYSTNTWGLSTDGCRAWAAGTYDTVWKSYRDSSWGPVDSTLSTSWSCTTGVCPWCHYWRISGIQLCLWGPNRAPSAMIYTCICIYSDGECPLSLGRLSTSEKQWMPVLYYFSSPWRLFHHHGPCCLWPWDPAALKPG